MIMKKKDKKLDDKGIEISPEFQDLFSFQSGKAEYRHEAKMIMFRFLSEIERVTNEERGLKKRLSNIINRSQSFITQLFNGDKIINLITLAKFQKGLGIKFKIIAYPESEFYNNNISSPMSKNVFLYSPNYGTYQPSQVEESSKKSSEFVQIIQKSEPALS